MRLLVAFAAALAATSAMVTGSAQQSAPQAKTSPPPAQPTFYRDVQPILRMHCQGCHAPEGQRPGALLAPMPLITFEDARPWAAAIARKVEAREMPPWFASEQMKGLFANERGLTDEQIATLTAWARSGSIEGRSDEAPPAPPREIPTKGWLLGEPDITILAEPSWINDDSFDELIEGDIAAVPDDFWLRGIEFRAGSRIVHHLCAIVIMPPGTPGPDRETSLGCVAPGAEPRLLPDGYAFFLPKGAQIRIQVHTHKRPGPKTGVWDQSALGLILSRTPVVHRVRFTPVSNTTFEIPPRQSKWLVGAARVFDRETTILALWPHGHLRTTAVTYCAVYPNGQRELLLDVPKYDQDWQVVYYYKTPKQVPAGTRVEVLYRYDNSEARGGRRGFDASRPVAYGNRIIDEMATAYIEYTDTAPPIGSHDVVAAGLPVSSGSVPKREAVDRDQFFLSTAKASTLPGLEIRYPRLQADPLASVDHMATDAVLSYDVGAAMRLRTDVNLDFAGVRIPAGNFTPDFPGVYGLWLKKVSTGWHLAFTNEPDVAGTQWNAAAIVAELPMRHERIRSAAGPFTVNLQGRPDNAQLVMRWGSHQWTAPFSVARK